MLCTSVQQRTFLPTPSRVSNSKSRDLALDIIASNNLCCHVHMQDHPGKNYQLERLNY